MSATPRYILIKDASVLPMDSAAPACRKKHDILIRDDRIASIGENIPQPQDGIVTVIQAGHCIAVPGFVDGHHHMWQQLLRGVATDWTLLDYTIHMRNIYGSLFTPEDVYLATYAAALSLLNNGVTCVLEHCHIINSPAHADAAVRALKDAGIRATFCYGFYQNPPIQGPGAGQINSTVEVFTHDARVADAARVRKQFFGTNNPATELVTFGIAPDEPEAQPIEKTKKEISEARDLGARIITMHVAMGPCDGAHQQVVQQLSDSGMLGPDLVFSHGASLTDDELRAIRDSGAGVVGTPDTELQMGMGFPVVFRATDAGCNACLGIDITSNQGNDFVAQMRLALQVQRGLQNDKDTFPETVPRKTMDVLRMGTAGGAEVMQLQHLIGTLAVGKKADLFLVSCDDLETLPVTNPVGSVVFHTSSPSHIETVIVDGKLIKANGRLIADTTKLKGELQRRGAEIAELAASCDITDARARWLELFRGNIPKE